MTHVASSLRVVNYDAGMIGGAQRRRIEPVRPAFGVDAIVPSSIDLVVVAPAAPYDALARIRPTRRRTCVGLARLAGAWEEVPPEAEREQDAREQDEQDDGQQQATRGGELSFRSPASTSVRCFERGDEVPASRRRRAAPRSPTMNTSVAQTMRPARRQGGQRGDAAMRSSRPPRPDLYGGVQRVRRARASRSVSRSPPEMTQLDTRPQTHRATACLPLHVGPGVDRVLLLQLADEFLVLVVEVLGHDDLA